MRAAHRIAARHLYDERNQHLSSTAPSSADSEIFIDLHGLHPAEAVSYLATALSDRRAEAKLQRDEGEGTRRGVLYAIVGTGTHSKNGRDKVGKAVRAYLNECRYAYREFGAPIDGGSAVGVAKVVSSGTAIAGMMGGDRGERAGAGAGGILGIDALSGDLSTVKNAESVAVAVAAAEEPETLPGSKDTEDEEEEDGLGSAKMSLAAAMQAGKVKILKAEDGKRGVGV